MTSESKTFKPIAIVAAALAWIVPGAGHFYLRRRARGIVIFITIGVTFWAGMAMGGAMTIYSEGEPWWFAADMFTGVHGLVAWRHHNEVFEKIASKAHSRAAGDSEQSEVYQQVVAQELDKAHLALVAPADTVARAYSGVAGLLNLLCIFDALMLSLMRRSGEGTPEADAPGPAGKTPPATEAA